MLHVDAIPAARRTRFTPAAGIAATNVQAAIEELAADVTALGPPIVDFKNSVRVASTANINLSSAPSSIDSVTLSSGDRVLAKDQSTGSQNGIYVFNGAGSAMTRATDADGNSEVTAGMVVASTEGTTNADKFWELTTNDPIIVGTTALTFAVYSGNVTSVFGRTGAVTATSGDYTATQITFTASGTIASTNVQSAIAELDSEMPERIDDRVASLLVAGTNITLTYDDTANTLTVTAAGTTSEQIDDRVAALLVQGTNITLAYNDGANTLTISAAGISIDDVLDALEDGYGIDWNITAATASTPLTIQPDRMVTYHVDTYSSTVVMSLLWTVGEFHEITLEGNPTLQFANFKTKKQARVRLIQDGTGGRVPTWNIGTITWLTHRGEEPRLSPAPGDEDTIWLICTNDDAGNGYANPTWIGWPMTPQRPILLSGSASSSLSSVASWSMDEASGTRIDNPGTADLTVSGTVGSASGLLSNAASISNAANNYLTTAHQSAIAGGNRDYTISTWFKPTSLGAGGNVSKIVAKRDGAGGNADYEIAVSQNQFYARVSGNTIGSGTLASDPTGSWHHAALVVDHTNSSGKIYFDGIVQGGSASLGSMTDNGYALCFGGYPGASATETFNGLIDQSDSFSAALNAAQILSLFNSGTPVGYPQNIAAPVSIDWTQCDDATITLTDSGTHTINHTHIIPQERRIVTVTNDGASGSLVWGGDATITWPAGEPAMPADGDSIRVEFYAEAVDSLVGWQIAGADALAGHFLGSGSTPAIAVGAGAGTGATASITGTDSGGEITLNTGTIPTAAATAFTVTFDRAYGSAPAIVFSPSNSLAALLSGVAMVFVTSTTTTFLFTAGATALTASTTYKWQWHAKG